MSLSLRFRVPPIKKSIWHQKRTEQKQHHPRDNRPRRIIQQVTTCRLLEYSISFVASLTNFKELLKQFIIRTWHRDRENRIVDLNSPLFNYQADATCPWYDWYELNLLCFFGGWLRKSFAYQIECLISWRQIITLIQKLCLCHSPSNIAPR